MQSRKQRHEAIESFGAEYAGTDLDLDPFVERAAAEYLSELSANGKQTGALPPSMTRRVESAAKAALDLDGT